MIKGVKHITPINNKFLLPSPKAKAGDTARVIKRIIIKYGFLLFDNTNLFLLINFLSNNKFKAILVRHILIKIP